MPADLSGCIASFLATLIYLNRIGLNPSWYLQECSDDSIADCSPNNNTKACDGYDYIQIYFQEYEYKTHIQNVFIQLINAQ